MWGGHSKLRYALIGLAPYSFHYDLSRTFNNSFLMTRYFIVFEDLHNFYVPTEDYRNFFRKEYFSVQMPLEPFDINNPFYAKTNVLSMTHESRLKARENIDTWTKKNYPETRDENIKILDDYLTLCEENNIRPIMFLPPMTEGYKKHFSRQKLDEFYYLVKEACKRHSSAVFLDGWKLQGFTDADFYDVDHMNIQGAAKFSAYLNGFIEYLENQSS